MVHDDDLDSGAIHRVALENVAFNRRTIIRTQIRRPSPTLASDLRNFSPFAVPFSLICISDTDVAFAPMQDYIPLRSDLSCENPRARNSALFPPVYPLRTRVSRDPWLPPPAHRDRFPS